MEPLDKALGTQHKGLTLVNQEFYRIKKKTKPLCVHAPRGTNIQISRKMVETFKQCERKQKQEGIRCVYSQLQIWFSSSIGSPPSATVPSPELQQDHPCHGHTPIFSSAAAGPSIIPQTHTYFLPRLCNVKHCQF